MRASFVVVAALVSCSGRLQAESWLSCVESLALPVEDSFSIPDAKAGQVTEVGVTVVLRGTAEQPLIRLRASNASPRLLSLARQIMLGQEYQSRCNGMTFRVSIRIRLQPWGQGQTYALKVSKKDVVDLLVFGTLESEMDPPSGKRKDQKVERARGAARER